MMSAQRGGPNSSRTPPTFSNSAKLPSFGLELPCETGGSVCEVAEVVELGESAVKQGWCVWTVWRVRPSLDQIGRRTIGLKLDPSLRTTKRHRNVLNGYDTTPMPDGPQHQNNQNRQHNTIDAHRLARAREASGSVRTVEILKFNRSTREKRSAVPSPDSAVLAPPPDTHCTREPFAADIPV